MQTFHAQLKCFTLKQTRIWQDMLENLNATKTELKDINGSFGVSKPGKIPVYE